MSPSPKNVSKSGATSSKIQKSKAPKKIVILTGEAINGIPGVDRNAIDPHLVLIAKNETEANADAKTIEDATGIKPNARPKIQTEGGFEQHHGLYTLVYDPAHKEALEAMPEVLMVEKEDINLDHVQKALGKRTGKSSLSLPNKSDVASR